MKINDCSFIPADENDRGPDGVHKHEQDCSQSGNDVEIQKYSMDGNHYDCSRCITHQTNPEKDQMPSFESAGKSFAPYPNGVTGQSQNHEYS